MGWVRAMTVDPGNQWFATGAGDRVVKVSHAFPECLHGDIDAPADDPYIRYGISLREN